MTMNPLGSLDVSIIISSWKDSSTLVQCIKSVQEQDSNYSFEVILALNEPSADFLHEIEQLDGDLVVVQSPLNLGFGGINNLASESARGRALCFLNDDTIVLASWLDPLVDALDSSESVGVVGSLLLNQDLSIQNAGTVIWSDATVNEVNQTFLADGVCKSQEVPYCSGASMLTRRNLFMKLGGFDQLYYPAYYEDADYCFKARSLGYTCQLEVNSKVVHFHSASSSQWFALFLSERNRSRFALRWKKLLAKFPESPSILESKVVRKGLLVDLKVLESDSLPSLSVEEVFGSRLEIDYPEIQGAISLEYVKFLESQLLDARTDAANLRALLENPPIQNVEELVAENLQSSRITTSVREFLQSGPLSKRSKK